MTDPRPILDYEQLQAILSYEALPIIVDNLVVNDSSNGGRPRLQSVFSLVFVHIAIRKTFGGRARRGIAELAAKWDDLAALVRELYPNRSDYWFTGSPLRRSHYYDFRRPYLDTDEGSLILRDALETSGVPLAAELELCQENGPGTRTNPDRSRAVEADGTLVRGASKYKPRTPVVDAETGELLRYRRCDPDVRLYTEGGATEPQRGHKVVIMSTRGLGWYQRVTLSVDLVGKGGEMATLEPMADRILPQLPDTLLLLFDAAARGSMREYLMRTHGVEMIAPPAAKTAAKSRHDKRIEKEAFLERVTGTYPDGRTAEFDLWVRGGRVHTVDLDEAGNRIWFPLKLNELHRRGRPTMFRFYGDYTTEDGARLTIRGLPTPEDRQRKFNRCENFRFFPKGSPQYGANYRRRNDTESSNRQLKDALWQRRAGSYGKTRVLVDVLGWAIGENAVAAYLHRSKSDEVPAAA